MGKKDTITLIAKNKFKRTTYELYRKLYSVHKWFSSWSHLASLRNCSLTSFLFASKIFPIKRVGHGQTENQPKAIDNNVRISCAVKMNGNLLWQQEDNQKYDYCQEKQNE